jgi:hypothetical protein
MREPETYELIKQQLFDLEELLRLGHEQIERACRPRRNRRRETELSRLLRAGQRLVLKYPVAARALFRAFVAEGRRFAETAEGRVWKRRLARSRLIARGRVVWELTTLNLLDEPGERLLPTALVEALARAATARDLEPLLAALLESGR